MEKVSRAISEAIQSLKLRFKPQSVTKFYRMAQSPSQAYLRPRAYFQDRDTLESGLNQENKGFNDQLSVMTLVLCNCTDEATEALCRPSLSFFGFISANAVLSTRGPGPLYLMLLFFSFTP